MKLVIHDLSNSEWDKISDKYRDYEIISDNGRIKSCVGCFGCWTKTPGECVIKDGYEHMGMLIHKADEVIVMSRYTYGGFSSFIKNVFDRSIGYVLPFFEIIDGEMHHKRRYPETKPMTFIFRGRNISEEDKEKARKYVKAVCTNLYGEIKSVQFEDDSSCKAGSPDRSGDEAALLPKTYLINCSYRGEKSNTMRFLSKLAPALEGEIKMLSLVSYSEQIDELVKELLPAKKIVLGMPLYVDGVPSAVLRLMQKLESSDNAGAKKIYVIANMGFYESSQLTNLMSMVKSWCDESGFTYCGGLAIGAGEMMGMMTASPNMDKGPARNIAVGLCDLANAINEAKPMEDFYADAFKFPRFLYILAANSGWPKSGKLNGLKKKDLYKQPELSNV